MGMGDDDRDRSRERARRDRPTRFSESSRDRSVDRGRSGGMKSSNCRVFVSNIPYEYRWQDMKDLFRTHVGDVQFVELFVDENDKSRGCGIVEFSDSASVKKCLEVMQRFEVKTRKLIIKEDTGNMRDKHGSIVGSGNKRGRGGDDNRGFREDRYDNQQLMSLRSGSDNVENKWGNTYGLSPNFLESLRIDTPLCNRVFVANLEYNIDKKKLKEIFRLAGRLVRVDLQHDKDGRSRGMAIVEYDHPVEAVQAVSMFHNQFLNDRPLTVRIDRVNENIKLPEGLKGIGMGLGTNGEPLKDVAHNLPSLTGSGGNNQQSSNSGGGGGGAGILGAVPNPSALQVANALGLNTLGGNAFGNLASNSSVLQAANLAGVQSLLGNGLSSADLSLATNLMAANPQLVQNSSQLSSALGVSGNNPGMAGSSQSPFSRDGGAFGQSQNYSTGGRNSSIAPFQFNSNNGRDNFGPIGGGGGGGGSAGNMMRSQGSSGSLNKDMGFSRKVIISNLPTSTSFKMLSEKFSEFGDIQHLEEKGTGSMLVVYGADWQAERAIKNLDRARIDGRTIEARFFY